ncbi:MAG: hypothetical protein EOO68_14100 [Moraxellaceae bacterium]|nr:MAG: hypothetical protein EOO68_14100 [Moraxellaceae bacterium]
MYVKRNEKGELIAVSQINELDSLEQLDEHSVELQSFIKKITAPQQMSLEQSDQAMARVLEDVVNLLVDQGTIRFTDLPEAAQTKLLSRRELRGQRQGMNLLDDGDDLNI